MSKAEIIAGLPGLSPQDLADVQAKLDELVGEKWSDRGELSDADRHALDTALSAIERDPDAGSTWKQAKARIEAKLQS